MKKDGKEYEPPRMKIYQFDDNEQILTASGNIEPPSTPDPTPDYAARALNDLMGGANTTFEK